jgi:putative DNA primase/helicase
MLPTVKQKMSIEEINQWVDFWRYEIGVNVIPSKTVQKKPIVGWIEWQHSPIPQEQHDEWKQKNMFKDGMAIITGKVWHNPKYNSYYLLAIDCDNKKGMDVFIGSVPFDEFAKFNMLEMHLDNSDKCHIYYYIPRQIKGKSSDAGTQKSLIDTNEVPAIEVKCDGSHGLMFASPSMHSKGHRYEVIGTKIPRILSHPENIQDQVSQACLENGLVYDKTDEDQSILKAMIDGTARIDKGHNRGMALKRWVGHMFASHPDLTIEQAIELAKEKDKQCFIVSLTESYGEKKIPRDVLDTYHSWMKEKLQTIDFEGLPRGTALDEETDEKRQKKPSHEQWADKLQEEFQFRTFEETDEVLWYYEGVYIRGGEIQIKKRCEQIIQECTTNQVNEVINAIRRRTYVSIKKFDTDPIMINLRNCWVNINDGSISEHSSEKLSLVQLDVFYDPSRVPVKFNMFLRQCHASPKAVYQLWESFSSCLLKTSKFSKAFMHIGLGANGKSVYLKVVNTFLGHENVSNMSIHTIENNRFAPAQLYGKLANIYADISSEELRHTGNFKNIVSGDNITAEKKGKDPFEFVAIAKMFFSANQIPKVFDESDGFFRRFIITEWDKQFSKSEQNPNLIAELTTDDEKSGILNILIAMAKQLNKRGHFKYDVSTEHLRSQWKKKSDSVSAFNDECMVFDPMMMIDKTRYYEKYIEYCRTNKIPPLTRKQDFINEVKNGTPLEDDGKPVRVDLTTDSWWYLGENSKEKSKLKRVWRGGMLKTDLPAKNGSIERYSEGKPHA